MEAQQLSCDFLNQQRLPDKKVYFDISGFVFLADFEINWVKL